MDGEARKEFWASLALRHCKGLGARSRARLLNAFGSAYQALRNGDKWRDAGLSQRQHSEITSESWRSAAQEEWDRAKKLDDGILLWADEYYPKRLRELSDAPTLLYCRGDVSLLRSPAIAIVGSRQATKRGCEVGAHMARHLSACGIAIVSGMALGIDRAVHEAALRETGKSIGILGTGIDKAYPGDNRALFTRMAEEGLLVSEFPPGTQPLAAHFPVRNRVISGLSLGVLVIEAASRSGSLITARLALEQNRDVFAVPGPALDAHCTGCQDLVRQGARPIFSPEDILRDLAEQLKTFNLNGANPPGGNFFLPSEDDEDARIAPKTGKAGKRIHKSAPLSANSQLSATPAALSERERHLLECLRKDGEMQSDSLTASLNFTAAELSPLLISLEMAGLVKRLPGARYKAL
ncbi:MAG: DNA-processing protein DprA [Desulfovibrio sp.]|nr:DNA-processing protein DprA [Desulfovibrio sp.]